MSGFRLNPDSIFDNSAGVPKRSKVLIITGVVLFVLVSLFMALAGFITDRMWFDSVGQTGVFDKLLFTRIMLFVIGFVFAAAFTGVNVWYAYKSRPVFSPFVDATGTARVDAALQQLRKIGFVGIPLAVGLLVGGTLASGWQQWLQFANAVEVGKNDVTFGMDIGFYLFQLPFYQVIQGFILSTVIVGGLAALVVHYLVGSIRPAAVGSTGRTSFNFTDGGRRHIAVLGGLSLFLYAAGIWLERYALVNKQNEIITGVTFVDANVHIPGMAMLAGIAVLVGVLFFVNVVRTNWTLPLLGVGLMLVANLLLGSAWPAFVQQVQVKPDEQAKESPYIAHNIAATRDAYGITDVEYSNYNAVETPDADVLDTDNATLENIRLMDPQVIASTVEQLQQLKGFYSFASSMDVSRYEIDGKVRGTLLAVREVNLAGIPTTQQNWVTNHLIYTHGIGLVAAYDNAATPDGEPLLFESDVPPQGLLGVDEPRVYFGEQSPIYSIVGGNGNIELDYPDDTVPSGQQNTSYKGEGGVAIGGLLNKMLFAARFAEANIILSEQVTSESRILYNRQPADRVSAVAPWLTLDGDPYAAVVDGRIVWILDAYTTSSNYPYSERVSYGAAVTDSSSTRLVSDEINYIRNSVKATVDAYDGTVTLYGWDETDPILQVWRNVFPDLITDKSEMSDELLKQIRYPEDLFKVQRNILREYHISDPDAFFTGENFWIVPDDPTKASAGMAQPPYYMNLQMPGATEASFSLTSTFAPARRPSLAAFMAVNSDAGENYGRIQILRLPSQTTIPGPVQAQNIFESDAEIATELSLLRRAGSDTVLGNLLTLPVGGGILYVEPIYVQSSGAGGYPLLRKVLVGFGQQVVLADSIAEGLRAVLGTEVDVPVDPEEPIDPEQPNETALQRLVAALTAAEKAIADGEAALADGNFAAYGAAQDRLARAIAAAKAAEADLLAGR
jgi:uncharacterized membrane protein (UPF0182 family)